MSLPAKIYTVSELKKISYFFRVRDEIMTEGAARAFSTRSSIEKIALFCFII
jgi:hypothetical protein